MRNAIILLSVGFILGRLIPPLFTEDRLVVPVSSVVTEHEIEDGSLQIYDFKGRFAGTNVVFTICCIAYSTEDRKIDIGTARLRTRLCKSMEYDGEWEWVTTDRIRFERTGDDTITATVVYPRQPDGIRRDFQFAADCEVDE